VRVDFERVADELYGLPLNEFTAARDARVLEARQAGDATLARSLKALRKPTVGAWLANLLARERRKDVEQLVDLGAQLRATPRALDGDRIRRVSKERAESVSRLVRDARALAARRGHAVSAAAVAELAGTLDAAFAHPPSADALRKGRLTTSLQYSGLGLGSDDGSRRRATTTQGSGAGGRAAERNLERANREATRADAAVEAAQEALRAAEQHLGRMKTAVADAQKQAADAHKRVTAAEKKATARRGRRRS
jgi:hypothetical protein